MTKTQTNSPQAEFSHIMLRYLTLFGLGSLILCSSLHGHEGPDPLAHWEFNSKTLQTQTVEARLGLDGHLKFRPRIVPDQLGESILFGGAFAECLITPDIEVARKILPQESFTVSAWVTVDSPQRWGGLVGCIQDNGNIESGWVLGYNQETFTFAVTSHGADDGDGLMTYLTGKTPYEAGKFYHVVGVYDGQEMQIFVNGELEANSAAQHGDILYPQSASLVIGAYRDDDEYYPHHGRIREISIYDLAAKATWVKQQFTQNEPLVRLPAELPAVPLEFVVRPYLQYATQNSMTVMWQTTAAASSRVDYGETAECLQSSAQDANVTIHEMPLRNLKTDTQYFYRVASQNGDATVTSEVRTFQTAVSQDTPFAFAVISDTQGNPTVSGKLAQLAWEQRPHFLLHPGDLVSTGTNNQHWIQHFFASMEPLISRVAMFPVLGNHEQNARNYYNYMSLPDPEYFYKFTYGNADFFMIDTNQRVDLQSKQYQWLDEQLTASKATWKFVCHHHPPYSSDENDYGDLWKTNRSSRGDVRARVLVPLYEEHNVDVVWNGHIHSYERTWPIRNNKAVTDTSPFYMITGGGGGGLETPGPFRPYFQNYVRRGHHYVMVHINQNVFEMRSFALNGQMFDAFRIEK